MYIQTIDGLWNLHRIYKHFSNEIFIIQNAYPSEVHVMLFTNNLVTVEDVLHKAKKRYGKNSRLVLLNADNIRLEENILVEKGKSYRVKRK